MGPSDQHAVADALAHAAHRRRVQSAVIGIALAAILAVVAWGVLQIAHTSADVKDLAEYLNECTTPSNGELHECYEQGREQTAVAIQTLLDNQEYNADLVVCLLSFTPEKRTRADVAHCRETAARGLETRED